MLLDPNDPDHQAPAVSQIATALNLFRQTASGPRVPLGYGFSAA